MVTEGVDVFDKWAYDFKWSLCTWPWGQLTSSVCRDFGIHVLKPLISSNSLCFHPTCHTQPEILMSLLSPLSCGCMLAMIHFTRQHFIRAFRENRGFCHFPESFTLPGAGSTPLASPSRLPSTTLPSAWREGKGGDEGGRAGSGREFSTFIKIKQIRLKCSNGARDYE